MDKARCNLRVGILSDTHLDPPCSDALFLRTLTYFSQRGVDAVVIAGDVTRNGSAGIRSKIKEQWEEVFPDGKREGRPVTLIVVTGANDTPQVYEDLAGEKFAAAFTREVNGYTFIGANWNRKSGVDAWSLKPLLAKVDRTRPFFYIQNLVPYATCCQRVTAPDILDSGKVTYMLAKFPNAVAICGRSHTPLTDESAFWRGEFSCVNAGSFAMPRTRDGRAWHELPNEDETSPSYAKAIGTNNAKLSTVHHGLVMSVYDSSVVFERFDFGQEVKQFAHPDQLFFEKVGPDWELALPIQPGPRPETSAPQFWDDTRLMIFPSEKSVLLRFPPVLAKHTGVRAYAYEVRCSGGLGGLQGSGGCGGAGEIVKTVYSPSFCRSEDHETQPMACRFSRDELPKGTVRFSVTPIDAFGRAGRPITGEVNL